LIFIPCGIGNSQKRRPRLDGHTNPRRDLKYLLRLIALMDFKLTFGPAPISPMSGGTGLSGLAAAAPGISHVGTEHSGGALSLWNQLQYDKSEEAATELLKNQTHLDYTRRWFPRCVCLG